MHLTSSELKAHATCLAALARAGHGTRTVDDVLGWVKAELEARGPGLASEEGSAPTSSSALSQEGPEEPTRPSVAPPQGPAPAQLFAKATHSSHLNYSDILQAFAATASGGNTPPPPLFCGGMVGTVSMARGGRPGPASPLLRTRVLCIPEPVAGCCVPAWSPVRGQMFLLFTP